MTFIEFLDSLISHGFPLNIYAWVIIIFICCLGFNIIFAPFRIAKIKNDVESIKNMLSEHIKKEN